MKLKHIVIALSLILATVPAGALAQGGDGQDAGSTNARIHIVLVGATASAPPPPPTGNGRIHIVIVGRENDEDDEDSETGGRQTLARAPRDRGLVQQLAQMVAPKISARVMRAALVAGLRMTF